MARRRKGQNDAPAPTQPARTNRYGVEIGFEAQLFLAAEKLRKHLETPDYKPAALGLISLQCISDAFETKHAALLPEDSKAAEDPTILAETVGILHATASLTDNTSMRHGAATH